MYVLEAKPPDDGDGWNFRTIDDGSTSNVEFDVPHIDPNEFKTGLLERDPDGTWTLTFDGESDSTSDLTHNEGDFALGNLRSGFGNELDYDEIKIF